MKVQIDVSEDVGRKIQHLPASFENFLNTALDNAVRQYNAVQDFLEEKITLTELANIFKLDHIDTIVWLKENGFNPPSIQGYSENGFTPELENRIDIASKEASMGVGLSPAFDNTEDLLEYLHKESDKENSNEN
ncbi:MAG: hypothetical protein H8E98_07885 [Bacteroidetes bacterium]|nr:hypothetical protein [Bacteroidota bacterium]